jgi:hypothetical protein
MRKHDFNDYEPEVDICYDKVKITSKSNHKTVYFGWKDSYNNTHFKFEYVKDGEYCEKILAYENWIVEYL